MGHSKARPRVDETLLAVAEKFCATARPRITVACRFKKGSPNPYLYKAMAGNVRKYKPIWSHIEDLRHYALLVRAAETLRQTTETIKQTKHLLEESRILLEDTPKLPV